MIFGQGQFQEGGYRAIPPPINQNLNQIGPHFGNHSAPSQYAALPNRKSWNCLWLMKYSHRHSKTVVTVLMLSKQILILAELDSAQPQLVLWSCTQQ